MAITETNLNTNATENEHQAYGAWLDAAIRSASALEANPEFFNKDHLAKVDQVKLIAAKFFKVKKAIYVTHRSGGAGRPPKTVVKIHSPTWLPGMQAKKKEEFLKPLELLGVTSIGNSNQGVTIDIFENVVDAG